MSLRVCLKSCLQSITGPVARIVYYGMASVAVHPRASSILFRNRNRKLWMEGPLLPKKPYPDLLHTPRETKESPGPYHSPTSRPSSPEVWVARMV